MCFENVHSIPKNKLVVYDRFEHRFHIEQNYGTCKCMTILGYISDSRMNTFTLITILMSIQND